MRAQDKALFWDLLPADHRTQHKGRLPVPQQPGEPADGPCFFVCLLQGSAVPCFRFVLSPGSPVARNLYQLTRSLPVVEIAQMQTNVLEDRLAKPFSQRTSRKDCLTAP